MERYVRGTEQLREDLAENQTVKKSRALEARKGRKAESKQNDWLTQSYERCSLV